MPIYRRTFAYFRPFLGQTIFGMALTLAGIALNLAKPWPVGAIIDGVITEKQSMSWLPAMEKPTLILWLCVAMVMFHLLSGLVSLVTNYIFCLLYTSPSPRD